jgi:ferredoxin-fold anticodon binding domain-containing protein
MRDWKKKNFKEKSFDYSFLVPMGATSEILAMVLSEIHDAEFKLIDEFKSDKLPSMQKSVTFRAYFFEDELALAFEAAVDEPAQFTSITVAKHANINITIQNKLLTFIFRPAN